MPVQKVKGGYRWGKTGKVYKTKAAAEKQGRAIHASGYSKGGSTVNAAGNYTKPTMRRNLVKQVMASDKGGKPGQWSARKAQRVAKEYKAKGGGYTS
jgi:hypothetical protein